MDAQETLDRLHDWAWDSVRNVDYPSAPMLDRLERHLRSPEEAAEYMALLIDKAGDEHKSPMMMMRAERMARTLAQFQRLREAAAEG